MIILGIETSCDETAAAILEAKEDDLEILSNVVSSQIELHSQWGGVVPNLAAREHLKNILPVIEEAFSKSETKPEDLDAIAITNGPGLIPALLIGVTTAKTLSYLWKKPLIGIHHIEAHIYANFLKTKNKIEFPVLALVVSGGHTQLVLMREHLNYEIVGETQDDAAGEAFDKVARILGLPYPGGPAVAAKAENFKFRLNNEDSKKGRFLKNPLPRPMIHSGDFNFSFSGLKTAVLYAAKKNEKFLKNPAFIEEMCYSFQEAAVEVLIAKTISAAKKFNPKTICLAGGVSANTELRAQLRESIEKNLPGVKYLIPDIKYSLDNAAMISIAGYFRLKNMRDGKNLADNWKTLEANANLKLK